MYIDLHEFHFPFIFNFTLYSLGEVVVTLEDADKPGQKGKCIAHKCCKGGKKEEETTFSQFFILGYR